MAKVYAWPPVGVISHDWTIHAPVNTSRSLTTGRRYVSAFQPRRRVVDLSVSGGRRYGAGYMEALKRYLDGGVHLVRLNSCKIPHGKVDVGFALRQTVPVAWLSAGKDVAWKRPSEDVMFYLGAKLTGQRNYNGPVPQILVEGLPPNSLVGLPGETIAFAGKTYMIAAPMRSNDRGAAMARVTSLVTDDTGEVSIGIRETAVFEAVSIPRGGRAGNEFTPYDWSFREVFADEVVGGFEEIDPWN